MPFVLRAHTHTQNKAPISSDFGPFRLVTSSLSSEDDEQSDEQNRAAFATNNAQARHRLDLFIDNVQAGVTTGEYTCVASNSEGSAEAHASVVLAVPAIITSVPRNQTRLEGERVELNCQAKAVPANVTYKWLFNDKNIAQLKWFDSRHSVRADGTLVIEAAHRDDQGEYKCQATNGLAHRSATSAQQQRAKQQQHQTAPIYAEAAAHLHVEYPARVTHSPAVQYLPLSLSGIIQCHVQAAPAVEFFTWTLNGQPFDPNVDANVERLANGSLLVKHVNKQYEGKYRCTPFNKHGSAGSSAAMDVRVEEPPYFELKPAESYRANINGHVKMPCDARGQPKPQVYWRKVVPDDESVASQHSNTRRSSGDDEPEDGAIVPEIELDEMTTPHQLYARQEQQQQQQQEQQSVIQEQKFSYAKLPSDRSEYKDSHLVLHALRKDDHGRYECVIENEVATLVASTMLYVEETTPHTPTQLRVYTKAWSAQLAWTPGYDGGFEQQFVAWYRQVPDTRPLPSAAAATTTAVAMPQQQQHKEHVDMNWKSVNVQPSDATKFTVQNLSQDTMYEFAVSAKNIIGESARSHPLAAATKRALSGSLAPVDATFGAFGLGKFCVCLSTLSSISALC